MAKRRKVKRVTAEERAAESKRIANSALDSEDTQRKAVYKWQSDALGFGNQCDWTLLECQRFISYVWHAYYGTRATPPRVASGRGSLVAHANRWVITLPLWARNRNIILHEVAHALLDACVGGPDKEGHGARFVRMEIELLVSFGAHGRDDLIKWARAAGLKVARRERVPRRRSCEETLAECKTKHYHSMGEDLADWMKKGTPRIVHVRGKVYHEHR